MSIGMPVYNGEPFLREAIDSVLAQTFADFELVVSDNASTDGTQEICRAYAARDRRFRYSRNEVNIGGARNFNRVFELSSADYFKLANADDICGSDLLADAVDVLDRYPAVVLCYGKTAIIDENGDLLRQFEDNMDLRWPSVVDRFRQAVRCLAMVNVLQGVIRSAVLRKTGLLGSYLASDMVLVAELSLYGQFHEIPRCLLFRRMHDRALSAARSQSEKVKFHDPQGNAIIRLDLWRYYFALVAALLRAPVTLVERAGLAEIILRAAFAEKGDLLTELGATLKRNIRRVLPI